MRTSAALLIMLAAIVPAAAAPVTYSFTGTIDQIGSSTIAPPAIGAHIGISITVEQSFAPDPSDPNSFSSSGFKPNSPYPDVIISAVLDGQEYANTFQMVIVTPNSAINFHATGPQVGYGFDLTLSGPLPGALPNAVCRSPLIQHFSQQEALS